MRCQFPNLRKSFWLGFLLLCIHLGRAQAWPTLWGSNKQPKESAAKGEGRPSRPELPGRAVLELVEGGGAAEEEGLSKTFFMKQGHSKALSSPDASCWQRAYSKLLSSCSLILQDEEKKCRLAFEFTDCFLRMTGWPPPPPCPDNGLVRFCTENFNKHTHEIYLAFFVETAAMCHHLQESFKGVNDEAQKAQAVFDTLRTELDDTNELLLKRSHDILSAQDAFVAKQGSILSTVDRMFSLYNSILYESRALKMVLFYGMSLVFVQVLTCAKQTNSARAYLYSGLFISMAMELYFMKAYGSNLQNQEWIQTCSYWIRAVFGVFTTTIIVYFISTYRDLSWQHHELLLKMHKKLSNIANESRGVPYNLDDGHSTADTSEEDQYSGHFFLRFSAAASSLSQILASKILRRALKFIRRRRLRKQGVNKPKNDAWRAWIEGRGLDSSTLQQSDDSSEEDADPDYQYLNHLSEDMALHSKYNLRSSCSQRTMCQPDPTNARRFRY